MGISRKKGKKRERRRCRKETISAGYGFFLAIFSKVCDNIRSGAPFPAVPGASAAGGDGSYPKVIPAFPQPIRSRKSPESLVNPAFGAVIHLSPAPTNTTKYIYTTTAPPAGGRRAAPGAPGCRETACRAAAIKGDDRMHFRVQTDEINYCLGMVTRAIAARPIRQAYDGVLIETTDDALVLTCTDGEISIKAKVSAIVEEDGCALLPAKLFAEMMRKQPAGEVDVRIDDRMRALIRSRGSNTSMACMAAEDFPDIRDVMGENVVNLPCKRLRDAISRVLFAVSTDESRKILTGILMEVHPEETLMVGLDGFRLALQRIEGEYQLPEGKDNLAAVVPGRIMGEFCRMLGDTEETATITCSKARMMMTFDNTECFTTLLTGEYIDYRKILPTSSLSEVKLRRDDFIGAIERASLMAREGKNNLLRLTLRDKEMTITANAERGAALERLPVSYPYDEFKIAFNARYLSDVVRNVDTDEMCMRFNTNVSPCLIAPVDGNQYTYLVLPVRVQNQE